ncbi:MAG: ProQ/FinO family protein [Hydrogenophilales bacterium]|nr:ProQ/FinO family protein [Hydrogenophilales bacterium]
MTASEPIKTNRNTLLDTLATTFAVFRDGRPLALGIHKTLRERMPELSQDQIRRALRIHTGSTRYLKALSHAEERFDLDGNPAGTVTPEQREQAGNQLKERFQKAAERRKEEEQAKQHQANLLKLADKFNTR